MTLYATNRDVYLHGSANINLQLLVIQFESMHYSKVYDLQCCIYQLYTLNLGVYCTVVVQTEDYIVALSLGHSHVFNITCRNYTMSLFMIMLFNFKQLEQHINDQVQELCKEAYLWYSSSVVL